MKLVIAATGASGTIYLQRLLEQIDSAAHEIHLVMSAHAKQVAKQEVGALKIPKAILMFHSSVARHVLTRWSSPPAQWPRLGGLRPDPATALCCARLTFS